MSEETSCNVGGCSKEPVTHDVQEAMRNASLAAERLSGFDEAMTNVVTRLEHLNSISPTKALRLAILHLRRCSLELESVVVHLDSDISARLKV